MTQTAHDFSNGEQIYGLALSAGIGGLELGIRLALGAERYRTVCYVEWESYAASTLVARMAAQEMDDAPIWDDVKTFDGRPWRGVVDLLTAGYPCQPFSNAGLKQDAARDIARDKIENELLREYRNDDIDFVEWGFMGTSKIILPTVEFVRELSEAEKLRKLGAPVLF